MKFRFAICSTAAALVMFGGAMADQVAMQSIPEPGAPRPGTMPAADAVVQVAAVTQEIARLASTAVIAPPITGSAAAADVVPSPPTTANQLADMVGDRFGKHPAGRRHGKRLAAADPKPPVVETTGKVEVGTAVWYGGRYIGRRTTSGVRLDTVHATAAHRTLPLNSLVRVTNLRNGRSIVVRVNDRGPLDDSLLIDMSPSAAAALRMKEAGRIPVRVEQVVEVAADTK